MARQVGMGEGCRSRGVLCFRRLGGRGDKARRVWRRGWICYRRDGTDYELHSEVLLPDMGS